MPDIAILLVKTTPCHGARIARIYGRSEEMRRSEEVLMRQGTTAVTLVLLVSVSCGRTIPDLSNDTDAMAEALWETTAETPTTGLDPTALGGESLVPGDSSHPTTGDCEETFSKFVRCCARWMACQKRATDRGIAPSRCDAPFDRCATRAHTDHPSCNCGADTHEEFQWACEEMRNGGQTSATQPAPTPTTP